MANNDSIKDASARSRDSLREMEEILRAAEVGRIALSDDSRPYIVPLNFLYENGKIVRESTFWDAVTALQQIGALKATVKFWKVSEKPL